MSATIKSTMVAKFIYIFGIPDEAHNGYLKIGEATLNEDEAADIMSLTPNCKELNNAAHKRIGQYTTTAGIQYQLLHTEITIFIKNGQVRNFRDTDVHRVLENSGIKKETQRFGNAKEWFKVDLETAKKAIAAVKSDKDSLKPGQISKGKTPIILRKEQRAAIALAKRRFKYVDSVLWNAKMRFGKTLTALQLFKEMCEENNDFCRMLIYTNRPVVNDGWFTDFSKIFYEDNSEYAYGSKKKGSSLENLEKALKENNKKQPSLFDNSHKTSRYVYFASLQDLKGSTEAGGNFDKNSLIFKINWDLIVIDEAHEGTRTEKGQKLYEKLTANKNTKVLNLSGTPFNIAKDFADEDIFTWSYVDEQKAKQEWEKEHEVGEYNPYGDLPHMNMFTYDLGKNFDEFHNSGLSFNFTEFFRIDKESSDEKPTFVHEQKVKDFITLLHTKSKKSNYPFSTDQYRYYFKHSFWIIPGVKEARALELLLKKDDIFSNFHIINVAGEGDRLPDEGEEYEEDIEAGNRNLTALEKVKKEIQENAYTITLSCGKLTTGVTVPEWTAVFMLYGSVKVAAAAYMQAMFRVQSPGCIDGKAKTESYVFDFAPDRALVMMTTAAKTNPKPGKATAKDREELGELLNFFPIIAISGSETRAYDVDNLLIRLKANYIERVVYNGFDDNNLYNDKLLDLNHLELKTFEELKGIIGETKSLNSGTDIPINDQGFDDEKRKKSTTTNKHPLTEEEKEYLRKRRLKLEQRKSAISILRGISIRMPMMIYGTELKDDEDVTLDNFTDKIDPKSWEEFMPYGVTKQWFNKIKQYYDPDIFLESGRVIRRKTMEADNLPIRERIRKIVDIFNTFKNPDKETVLTPWRVVNMQLSDTMGGYSFYDKKFEGRLDEPRFIDRGSVTNRVFADKESKILELNSKSGLYPLYMAYSLYRERCKEYERIGWYSIDDMTIDLQLDTWDNVLHHNVFVVCKTKMAETITKRTLSGYRKSVANTKCFDNLIDTLRNEPETFIKKVVDGKNYWKINRDTKMKFNAIVGNPPYQEMDGGNAASDAAAPIYQFFVDIAKKLEPKYLSLILPSKWMIGGRSELSALLSDMKSDKRLSLLIDYENDRLIFPTTHIDGGICYFLWDNSKQTEGLDYIFHPINGEIIKSKTISNPYTDYVIRDINVLNILNSIYKGVAGNSFSSIVSKTKPFGIRKDLFNNPEKYPTSKLSDTIFKGSTKIYGVKGFKGGAKRTEGFVTTSLLTDKYNALNKYKLFFTTSYSANAINAPEPILASPNEACTETFLVIGPFETKEQMINCYSYMKTKLFKFLLYFGHGTMQVNQNVFKIIPLVDFTVTWTDKKLYKKYGLTEEEIGYIEKIIKPMDDKVSTTANDDTQAEMDL